MITSPDRSSFTASGFRTIADRLIRLRDESRLSLQEMSQGFSNPLQPRHALYRAAIMHGFALAMWRLPQEIEDRESNVHAIVDLRGKPQPVARDFTTLQPGFLFSPFMENSARHALLIGADIHLHKDVVTLPNNEETLISRNHFLATYQGLLNTHSEVPARWYTPEEAVHTPIVSQREYERLVNDAIEFILRTGIRKVVTSRVVERALPAKFDPVVTFERLCKRYPHAFVSLVAIPNIGTWIGATPETLVRIDEHGVQTMALAGTQARPSNLTLEEVGWGAKEIEEQAIVSNDIREFFQRAGVGEIEEKGPRTVAAGNVVHLQTMFRVTASEADRQRLANQILTVLHPTSAVCGMPKERALHFIETNERHDRSFYSGFLGPVQMNQRSALFVNLRCMQLVHDHAHLYVGGGITGESDPSSEWNETELKARTLLDVLRT